MDDSISREATLKFRLTAALRPKELTAAQAVADAIAAYIQAIPAADVVEVRHGRWVVKGDAQPMSNDKVYGCSLCDDKNRRYYEWQLSNYCPNCGAKMDGGQDEEVK